MKWTTVCLVLAVAIVCTSTALPATKEHQYEITPAQERNVEFFISGIINILLKPIKHVLVQNINAIINSLKDQGGHLVDSITKEIDKIAEILRPFIIRILNSLNDIIGEGIDLATRLRMSIEKLFEILGVITETNKELVKTVIKYMVDKLLGSEEIMSFQQHKANTDIEKKKTTEFIISGILQILLRPLKNFVTNKINGIINKLKEHGGNLVESITKEIDALAEILRPFIIRILNSINDIIGEGLDFAAKLKMAVEKIFELFGVINETNKEMIKTLIAHFVKTLLNKISPEEVAAYALVPEDKRSMQEKQYIISGILEILLKPLKTLIANQINAIINSIKDQGGHLIESIVKQIDKLAELLRPFIIRIINSLNDIIGEGIDLATRIKLAVEKLFEYLGVINETNKEIVKTLVGHFVKILLDKLYKESAFNNKVSINVFGKHIREKIEYLINGILELLLKPLKNLLLTQINSIINSIKDQGGHLVDSIKKEIDKIASLLRPSIIKILNSLNDIIGESMDLAAKMKLAIEKIFEWLGVIKDSNKEIITNLIDYFVKSLLGMISKEFVFHETNNQNFELEIAVNQILTPIIVQLNHLLTQVYKLFKSKEIDMQKTLEIIYHQIVYLIQPYVLDIIRMLKDLNINISNIEGLKTVLLYIIEHINGVSEDNKIIFKVILDDVLAIIIKSMNDLDRYSVLISIINMLFQPFILAINELVKNISEGIMEEIVTKLGVLLAPCVDKVLDVLQRLGIGGKDVIKDIRYTLELIVTNVHGLSETAKKFICHNMANLITAIVNALPNN